jgi:hypothetical protein
MKFWVNNYDIKMQKQCTKKEGTTHALFLYIIYFLHFTNQYTKSEKVSCNEVLILKNRYYNVVL